MTNDGDIEATVHWHGLRLENRYDGVPHETQAADSRSAARSRTRSSSPMPGSTGTTRTSARTSDWRWACTARSWSSHRTLATGPRSTGTQLTLDDLLVEDGHIAPFRRSGPTFTAMGRFGNVMLINGEPEFSGDAAVGEVVRLYVVNTANTRIFNFGFRGARMKLVGGDSGRYERETFVDEVLLAPSERAVLDVLFETPGDVRLEHRTPDHVYDLGAFSVAGTPRRNGRDVVRRPCESIRNSPPSRVDRARSRRPPDKVLAFVASMPLLYGDDGRSAGDLYACPMHPEVTSIGREHARSAA